MGTIGPIYGYPITQSHNHPRNPNLIAELDEFKGLWQSVSTLCSGGLQQLRKLATIESVGSSTRIEGAKLSDREVQDLLSKVHNESFTTRDEQEVAGYGYVCEGIFQSYKNMPFTENTISICIIGF